MSSAFNGPHILQLIMAATRGILDI